MMPAQQERPALRPYQAEFVEHVASSLRPGDTYWLIAPAGLGKSVAVSATIRELWQRRKASHVLIVCPRALVEQWVYMLRIQGVDGSALMPEDYRLLRESIGPDSALPVGAFVLSIDFAKKEDVAAHLRRTQWDLVVVDEANRLAGQRERLVAQLRSEHSARLMIAGVAQPQSEGLSAATSVTDWRSVLETFLNEEASGLALERRVVEYRRTPAEVAFYERVVVLSGSTTANRGRAMLRLALSSPSALESALIRWSTAEGIAAAEAAAFGQLLEALEDLHADSHLECALGIVRDIATAAVSHVLVFCNYVDTARYVAAAVKDLGLAAFVLHGALASDERERSFVEFRDQGGVLVTTVVEGMSLAFVTAVIHYDSALSAAARAQREGRFWRYGRSQRSVSYTLQDTSEVRAVAEALQGPSAMHDEVTIVWTGSDDADAAS